MNSCQKETQIQETLLEREQKGNFQENRRELIFKKSAFGRVGCNFPVSDTPGIEYENCLGELREDLSLPEVGELEVLRHFVALSHCNYGIETGFYPLGSCTMKYNPRINEEVAGYRGFVDIHPMQPAETVSGALEVLVEVQHILAELTGFSKISMQPLAGAHGELTCLMMIQAFHQKNGEGSSRKWVLVPDSAHGTNPATAAMCGYQVRVVPTDSKGRADMAALQKLLSTETAAIMLTNPSTLGLFEKNIEQMCQMAHEKGVQVFCDGANMNAMVGTTRPGDHGFDCMHLNLHKTFSTPHGGGGPGCGAIGIQKHLEPFLPTPVIRKNREGKAILDEDYPESIGKVSAYYGQFLMIVRALAYLLSYGREHIKKISEHAVLNANYVMKKLEDVLPQAYPGLCMHECVLTAKKYKKEFGIRALDMSKRLIDYGFHPPTNYFPLIVPEAFMIEPTETETKQTLDAFIEALKRVCREAENSPELLKKAPTSATVERLDEASAARTLDVKWSETGER